MKPLKSTVYKHGEDYDKIFNHTPDIKFWLKLTKRKNGIIELGCGTGRLLINLCRSHSDVTGIDNSKEMLAVTKAKTTALPGKVQLYKRNITRFNLRRTFNSILLINNTFNHLQTETDALKFITCLKKHMTLDTEFILETTPANILDFFKFNTPINWGNYVDEEDGKKVEVIEKSKYIIGNKLVRREWAHYKENKLLRKSFILIRFYTPSEIQKLFANNGFSIIREYGGYNNEPYTSSSKTYISVIKKNQS